MANSSAGIRKALNMVASNEDEEDLLEVWPGRLFDFNAGGPQLEGKREETSLGQYS